MLKIIDSSAWDYERPNSLLLPVRSGKVPLGSGDRRLLAKVADEQLLSKLARVEKLPGEELVHMLAVGSTEFFGCFSGHTPIAMEDGTYCPIREISVGDLVLTADRGISEVTHLFHRTVQRSLRIDVCGLPDILECTLDHPFRIARKEQFVCCHDKYKRCLPPTQGQQNICNRPVHFTRDCVLEPYGDITSDWDEASSLREGDFLVWTAPNLKPPVEVSAAEGYLLGAWLAEGSFQKNPSNKAISSVNLSIHAQEDEFLQSIRQHAAAMELMCRDYQYPGTRNENSRQISITGNPALFRLWHTFYGEYSLHKKLPPWVCCLPRPTRLAIVAGYIDGDGSCVVDEKENRTTVRSHGDDLSAGFQRLCWSLGLPAVRCFVAPKEDIGPGWNVSIANSYLKDVEDFSWKVRGRDLKQTTKVHGFFHQNRMYMPVRNIEQSGELEVFNMEVAGDHSYSGPNVDSHNCNRNGDGFREPICRDWHPTFVKYAYFNRDHKADDPKVSYGHTKLSHYNERMHRIELVAALNATREAADRNGNLVADLEMQKLASGQELPVSMGCRTPYDTCSYCGNQSRSRADYCTPGICKAGGLKYNMGRILDNGDVLHADNPEPTFNDISHITRNRQADRIAYVTGALHKMAADSCVISGAELAELYYAPDDGQSKLAALLTSIITHLNPTVESLRGVPREPVRLPGFPLEKLSHMTAALADVGVVLSITDFARVLTGRGDLPHDHLKQAAQLGCIRFQDAEDNPYRHYGPLNSKYTNWANFVGQTHSLKEAAVRRRAATSVLDDWTPGLLSRSKTAGTNRILRDLGEQYGLYVMAALERMQGKNPEVELTAMQALIQNHTH